MTILDDADENADVDVDDNVIRNTQYINIIKSNQRSIIDQH